MELIAVNRVDLERVPAAAQTEICRSALEGVMKCRKDPEWQERFRKWKEERGRA
jgi:hypothetical protein